MRYRAAYSILKQCIGEDSLLKRRGFILLLSHMRGYTSVLSHVIGSHPDVVGYAETHQRLRRSIDLLELSSKVEKVSGKSVAGKYVFDKLLHDRLIWNNILDRKDVTILVTAREPVSTVASILKTSCGGLTSIEDACAYYVQRLGQLAKAIERRRGRACFIDSATITTDTDRCLSELSKYLALRPGLSDRYQLFPKTGKTRWGDTSENINQGVVIRSQGPSEPDPALLEHRDMQLALAAYQSFRGFALEHTGKSILMLGDASLPASENDFRKAVP